MISNLAAVFYSFQGFFSNVRIVDFFDVLIIALLLYTGIMLFRRAHSWPILAGIGILAIVYFFAQTLNLYLTSLVLRAFFGVFIVVLVIIFNHELRHFFELISFWSTRQFRIQRGSSGFPFDPNDVFQAISKFANKKWGALIIFPGLENIDRFVKGGRSLDGLISEELLESIFDPHSIGHDGAVIISGNRIAKFGTHLPLSSNFKQLGKRGTRHSAAIGITEHTDAFAVVVSEERGTISVAHHGKLREFASIEELEASLKRFYKETLSDPAGSSFWKNIIMRHPRMKLLAVTSALVIWFFFSFQAETIQRSFSLPVVFRNLPQELFIDSSTAREVTVTLVSRGQLSFEKMDENAIQVAVDAKDFTEGRNVIVLAEDMVDHPSNFSVVQITPSQITIQVKKFGSFDLPIEGEIQGKVATGYRISDITVDPEKVGVLVPDGFIPPDFVVTRAVDVTDLKESRTFSSKLILPANMRFRDTISPTVSVRVTVVKR